MSIHLIKSSSRKDAVEAKPLVSRDCGPAGCEVDWLTSKPIQTEGEIEAFTDYAVEQGWGDGLPVIPPRWLALVLT